MNIPIGLLSMIYADIKGCVQLNQEETDTLVRCLEISIAQYLNPDTRHSDPDISETDKIPIIPSDPNKTAKEHNEGWNRCDKMWRDRIISAIKESDIALEYSGFIIRDKLDKYLSDTEPKSPEAIERLNDTGGWIKCSERLPNEEVEFLGWNGYYESIMYLSKGCFYYTNDYEAKPTHWQLLPEPPKSVKP